MRVRVLVRWCRQASGVIEVSGPALGVSGAAAAAAPSLSCNLWDNPISRDWAAADRVWNDAKAAAAATGGAAAKPKPKPAEIIPHCWNCGGVGHSKADCPDPPSGLTKGQIRRRRKYANRRPVSSR
eukprot:SAG22_NODE_170_length_16713_cov_33.746298_2_plen_126_part_00